MDRLEEKMSIAIPELPSADAGTHIPRSPVTHELKIFPEFFQYVQSGAKTFELRRDDRDYQTGDHLLLREWAREGHFYTGRDARRQISYVLRGWDGFGLQPGFCILALAPDSGAARDMGSRVAAPVDQQPRDRPNTSLHSEEKEETR